MDDSIDVRIQATSLEISHPFCDYTLSDELDISFLWLHVVNSDDAHVHVSTDLVRRRGWNMCHAAQQDPSLVGKFPKSRKISNNKTEERLRVYRQLRSVLYGQLSALVYSQFSPAVYSQLSPAPSKSSPRCTPRAVLYCHNKKTDERYNQKTEETYNQNPDESIIKKRRWDIIKKRMRV